jgi:chemotaxis protein CheD
MTAALSHFEDKDPRADRRVHLIQGEFKVSGQAGLVLTTTLGSCVSCCLHDPVVGVGGMNHFLLPHGEGFEGPDAVRYGAHAMELLINGMLHAGARKSRLEAKLFGGGRQSDHLPDVGAANAAFAEGFLGHEGIAHLGGSTGGAGARRIQFWPSTGRVRQLTISGGDRHVFQSERIVRSPAPESGSVEFFEDAHVD